MNERPPVGATGEDFVAWKHSASFAWQRWVRCQGDAEREAQRSLRPLLHDWSRVPAGAELSAIRATLEAWAARWKLPQPAIDFPLWSVERGRPFSGWELAHLGVERWASRPGAGYVELDTDLWGIDNALERIMVVAVAGYPERAQELAASVPATTSIQERDGRWIAWIAGATLTAAELAVDATGRGDPALRAAILGEWEDVLAASPAKALGAGRSAVTNGPKALVQLARLRLGQEAAPTERVVRASFGRVFAWSYHRNTTYNLTSKAPYVYLYGRELAATVPAAPKTPGKAPVRRKAKSPPPAPASPAQLVASIATHIGHLSPPPAPTFTIPKADQKCLAELLKLVTDADKLHQPLWSERTNAEVRVHRGEWSVP